MQQPPPPASTKDAIPESLKAFIDSESVIAFAIALGLGLLIGLQQERTKDRLGGIRTYPLIGIFGALAARIGALNDIPWLVPTGLLCMTTLIVLGNLERIRGEQESSGITTEVSALLMYLLGAFLILGDLSVAVVLGGTTAVLLHLKPSMHRFAHKLPEQDLHAIMQFALISMIILPVLPNRTFGPYDVLNPFKIWLLVVLIVGIGLGGYGAYKLVGARAGTLLSGLIGGLISSTATTVSYARRAKTEKGVVNMVALVILIASTSMFIRMFVEIAVVSPHMMSRLLPPLVFLLAVNVTTCSVAYRFAEHRNSEMPEQSNPAELVPALLFAALFAVILLAIAAARDYFGDRGIYVVALISGFTDVDAITLSSANLAERGTLSPSTAWRAMVIALLANLALKAAAAGVLGGQLLFRRLLLLFAAPFVSGLAVILLWP
ncbi:MgtC/SapB family protein [Microbulbifer thermotolerans]|uniref:MgtC/SapB family protein n=1 Tax=Microbulbifer thermotolerans TaxID=252514 RepID=UPI0009EF302A|nr:DUF4010 domain-containing protein [Microbulbifer thermotolerans]